MNHHGEHPRQGVISEGEESVEDQQQPSEETKETQQQRQQQHAGNNDSAAYNGESAEHDDARSNEEYPRYYEYAGAPQPPSQGTAYFYQPGVAPPPHHHQQQQQQHVMSLPPDATQAMAMAQYYEACMRDHAAAYASAAAGAAWAAAQIAHWAADVAASGHLPVHLPPPLPGSHLMIPPPPPPPVLFGASVPQHPLQPAIYSAAPLPPAGMHVHSTRSPPGVSLADMSSPPSVDDIESIGPFERAGRKRQQKQATSTNTMRRPRRSFGLETGENSRSRPFSDGDSSTSSGYYYNHYQQQQHGGPNLPYRHRRNHHHHEKKTLSDQSLIGKTAVAALYEWCSKRQRTPQFVLNSGEAAADDDNFTFVVTLDGQECGRGSGRTKNAAKQEAARRALQTVLKNGVVFDDATGILIALPDCSVVDELAPNLAERLAIGKDETVSAPVDSNSNNNHTTTDSLKKRSTRNAWNVYPGTSTTSEEEDENAYYTSRGASVCSTLLFAMIQIDPRIRDQPQYTYKVAEVVQAQRKRKVTAGSIVKVTRGSFSCTARLKLYKQGKNNETDVEEKEEEEEEEEILEAEGVGGTKRESRQVACAKLLALLFPECKSMVEVKAAAEAARERYAASKASKTNVDNATQKNQEREDHENVTKKNVVSDKSKQLKERLLCANDDPKLPEDILTDIRRLTGSLRIEDWRPSKEVKESAGSARGRMGATACIIRQHSRQQQLWSLVDSALQVFNEVDDEGRVRPDELTENDVGRTILRRAELEDYPRIKKLLCGKRGILSSRSCDKDLLSRTRSSSHESLSEGDELASRIWSSPNIALLLCRATSPHEDPPLACALFTIGFSMEKGRLFRVTNIESEPHLPRERFVECLEGFSKCMKCELEMVESAANYITMQAMDVQDILSSYLDRGSGDAIRAKPVTAEHSKRIGTNLLQSVREESEVSDASNVVVRAVKRGSNPSKRSRFE